MVEKSRTTREKDKNRVVGPGDPDRETIFSAIPDALINPLIVIDRGRHIKWANSGAETTFGRDLVRKTCYEAMFGRRTPCRPCIVQRAFDDLEAHEMEIYLGADTEKRRFRCTASVLPGTSKANSDLALVVVREMSSTEDSEESLRIANLQLTNLLDSLPVVPYICRSEGEFEINYVSAAIEEVTGYRADQVTGDPLFWTRHIHPDDLETFSQDLKRSLVQEKSHSSYRFLVADGTFRWLSDRRRVVKGSGGRIINIVGAWQDITEERKLRQESEYRLQQVIQADKLASLGEVVAGVAHEINNPNSFITYNIPLLEETWKMILPILEDYAAAHPEWRKGNLSIDELRRDMGDIIRDIRTGSDRISRVVGNLKEFARPDLTDHVDSLQVNDVIEKAMMIVGAQLRKSVGRIEVRLSKDLPGIRGHFHKLEQVVTNLLVNAINAVPSRDVGRVSIVTRYIERIRTVVIEVEDNGVGMGPEEMNHIFEPFFTTRRDKGGTGLGLSVSYGLIREHNGAIGVLSRPGLGSRFTLFLPLDREDPPVLRPSILCVDDDAGFLSELEMYFVEVRKMGLETTNNPEGVIDYLEDHPEVDTVLSDIMMPGLSGWELLEKIKNRFPLLTVILYTGYQASNPNRRKDDFRPDALLQKPFRMKELVDIIERIGRQRI